MHTNETKGVVHSPDDHTDAPAVDHMVVSLRAVHDLRSKICRGAAECLETAYQFKVNSPTQTKTYMQGSHGVNDLGEPEIGNFDYRWVVVSEEDVLRLQVSVSDSKAVIILRSVRVC